MHEDAFFMVSQAHWEDDVIWDGDDIKHKVCVALITTKDCREIYSDCLERFICLILGLTEA